MFRFEKLFSRDEPKTTESPEESGPDLESLKSQVQVELMNEAFQCRSGMDLDDYDTSISELALKFQYVTSEKEFVSLLSEIPPVPNGIKRSARLQMIIEDYLPDQEEIT